MNNQPFGQSNFNPGMGGGGFGQQQQPQQQQQQPSNPFFGSSTNISTNQNQNNSNMTSSSPFGMPSSTNTNANTNVNANANTGFGSAFGNPQQQQQQQSAFGASPFGSSPSVAAPSTATSTAAAFGTSSNIVSTSVFGNTSSSANVNANANTSNTGFGSSVSTGTGTTNSGGFASGGGTGFGFGGMSTTSGGAGASVFGSSPNVRTNVNAFGASSTVAMSSTTSTPAAPKPTSTTSLAFGQPNSIKNPAPVGAAGTASTRTSTLNANANVFNMGSGFGGGVSGNNGGNSTNIVAKSPFGTSSSTVKSAAVGSAATTTNNPSILPPFSKPSVFGSSSTTATTTAASTNDNTATATKDEAQETLAKLRERIMKKKREYEEKAAAAKGVGGGSGGGAGATGGMNTNMNSTNSSASISPIPFNSTSAKISASMTTTSTSKASIFGSGNGNEMAFGIGASNNNNNNAFSKKDRIPKNNRKHQNQDDNDNNSNKRNKQQLNNKSPKRQNEQHQSQQLKEDDDEEHTKSLAERNAKRFAKNHNRNLTSLLPSDLKEQRPPLQQNNDDSAQEDITTISSNNDKGNEDTIGQCIYMCPDDELIRREKESDIQLLEIPHESIFPKGWTLRESVVKRFRRSAADYTLNIPELVRPPHVLEIVCGYLEEWVMERDRQGVDPRFCQTGEAISPPPLDVYQFIWDRTRMVRKDFTLQNYTGTGGKCNAVAVRCHERIARWHCMCEHQLSHLPDFITMQSQQNIQELGQTMKTLNMYYDDADSRATKEDLNVGTENVGSAASSVHGCRSDVVMGKDPVDYDGKTLVNDPSSSSIANRIIGRVSKTNGTAEPEMRGLYILLTINNDGGMEVLKYSARLSEQNPAIFNSRPVQLALQVYKAKREFNYSRFFSILRSKSTPYLFGCIMFKYVEQMRKAAFRIMNRTFGTRRKDTGEGVYDSYPLQDLVHLLCFENLDEAREACKHYNIAVKAVPKPSNPNEHVDVIFWRQSDFKEKIDASKGTVINLKPRKMCRTIETKLGGATKLAICRGEVSGDSATLDAPVHRSPRKSVERSLLERSESRRRKLEEERIKRENEIVEVKRLEEQKRILLEAREKLLLEEQKRVAKQRKDQEMKDAMEKAARQRAKEMEEAKRREELERKRKLEAQKAALQREAEEKIRIQKEKEFQAAEKIRLQQELELKRRKEIERKAAEEIRRTEEIKKRRQEEHRRQQEIARRVAEELRRQKEQELVRLKEEQKKAEEMKIEMEWKAKIETAKKFLLLQRWRAQLSSKRDKKLRTVACLENLDPTQGRAFPISKRQLEGNATTDLTITQSADNSITYEEFFYQLSSDASSQYDLSQMMMSALDKNNFWNLVNDKRLSGSEATSSTFLFKFGIFVPNTESLQGQEQLANMIKLWIDSRLKVNHVHIRFDLDCQVRTVATFIDEKNSLDSWETFDAIMVIIPPTYTEDSLNYPCQMEDFLRITINLNDIEYADGSDFDDMLHDGCEALFDKYTSFDLCNNIGPGCNAIKGSVLERLSLKKICVMLMKKVLWTFTDETNYLSGLPSHLQRSTHESAGDRVFEHCFSALSLLFERFDSYCNVHKDGLPGKEFIDNESNEVPSYFSEGEGLPVNWADLGRSSLLEDAICDIFLNLENSTHLESFLQNLLDGAPTETSGICIELYQDRQYRRCLDCALQWCEESNLETTRDYFFYLPVGMAKDAINDTIEINIEQVDTKQLVEKVDENTPISGDFAIEKKNNEEYFATEEDLKVVKKENITENVNHTIVHDTVGNKKSSSADLVGRSRRLCKRKIQGGSTFDKDLKKSKNFTANLKSLVEGGSLDMMVGESSLSKILNSIDQ